MTAGILPDDRKKCNCPTAGQKSYNSPAVGTKLSDSFIFIFLSVNFRTVDRADLYIKTQTAAGTGKSPDTTIEIIPVWKKQKIEGSHKLVRVKELTSRSDAFVIEKKIENGGIKRFLKDQYRHKISWPAILF